MGLSFKDPLRAALISRATFHGFRGLDQFVPITPPERTALVKRLELDDQNMVCTSCGSTKPMAWYLANGAVSCCTDREMVSTVDLLAELRSLRAAPAPGLIFKLIRALQRADKAYWRACKTPALDSPSADAMTDAYTGLVKAKEKLFKAAKAAKREKP